MTHETLRIKAGGPWRELPNNANTQRYIEKLSFAATVFVLFDSGEAQEWECGKSVKASMFASEVIPKEFLAELADHATCGRCGGDYDPTKGSCGCFDNGAQ